MRSERLSVPDGVLIACAHCGEHFKRSRPDAVYCSPLCRKLAFDERARSGKVASIRILKNGLQSITVHVKDGGVKPGDEVRIG